MPGWMGLSFRYWASPEYEESGSFSPENGNPRIREGKELARFRPDPTAFRPASCLVSGFFREYGNGQVKCRNPGRSGQELSRPFSTLSRTIKWQCSCHCRPCFPCFKATQHRQDSRLAASLHTPPTQQGTSTIQNKRHHHVCIESWCINS